MYIGIINLLYTTINVSNLSHFVGIPLNEENSNMFVRYAMSWNEESKGLFPSGKCFAKTKCYSFRFLEFSSTVLHSFDFMAGLGVQPLCKKIC